MKTLVLLSGGMDSVSALHWALGTQTEVRAIGFRYGQENADQEIGVAGTLARELGVPFDQEHVTAIPRAGLLAGVQDHVTPDGLHPAFVPGRNGILAWHAAGFAASYWGDQFSLVIGANADDAAGFPDCRPMFFDALERSLCLGLDRKISVVTPFVSQTKREILRWAIANENPLIISHVSRSWSCYRRTGPCHRCSACVLRAAAFDTVLLRDQCTTTKVFGGDPARAR